MRSPCLAHNSAVTVVSVLLNPEQCCSRRGAGSGTGMCGSLWENSARNLTCPQHPESGDNQCLRSACAALGEPKCSSGFCSLFFCVFSLDAYLYRVWSRVGKRTELHLVKQKQ